MGVYIKDMEMPKDGCHHIICIYADGTVATGRREYRAVPVPPHGRLIDADALCDGLVSNHPVVIHANAAPTIIEGEE